MPASRSVRSAITIAMMLGAPPVSLRAQSTMSTTTETDFTKDPGGVSLVHLAKGVSLATGATRDGWVAVTLQGWVAEAALHDDKRDGFDVSVSTAGGTPLRAGAGTGGTLGTARLGALFDRLDTRGVWVHVRRAGWVAAASVAAKNVVPSPGNPSRAVVGAKNISPLHPTTTIPTPSAKNVAPPTENPSRAVVGANDHSPLHPSGTIPTSTSSATIPAGAPVSLQPDGPPFANVETPVTGDIVERRDGWTHLRIDAWVRDAELGNGETPGGITAADLRANPDKYVGQTVEWTVQVLGVETADELRPEMPDGQPYVLARGPLPESGFVYVMIPKDSVDAYKRIEPLTKIRIRATIHAGKSRFLPTPVLDLVRRLD